MVWRLNTQKARRVRPTVSMGSLRVGVSRLASARQLTIAQTRPTGTLMRKLHPQW